MPRGHLGIWNPRDVPSRSGHGWFVEVGHVWYGPYSSRKEAKRAGLRGSHIFHSNELSDRPGWLI